MQDRMGDEPAIVTEGLTKSYRKVRALTGVSIVVPPGSVFGLLGPNGAGKTTLVRILATLLRPDAGTARVAGFDVQRDAAQLRAHIGIAGQYAAVDENLTGFENLEMVGRLYHLGGKVARSRADELLQYFDLHEAGRRTVKTYSGGMRRRLDLAAALVARPPVIFLDEPTTGLDPQARRQLWELIEQFKRTGRRTILLTTHYMEEAERLCDRVAIMDHGKVIALGTPRELIASIGVEHLVEFSAGEALDASALARIEGIRDVRTENGNILMQVTALHRAVPALLDELGRQGVPLTELRTHSASLEDVFVALTGRHLRDE
jgi:ABC-2 type transport system ATP-binding protein